MINVKILAREYGHKSGSMTTQQFKEEYNKLSQRGNWAIFSEDTNIPLEERTSERINASDVKDGMSLTLVPQLAGG